MNKNFIVWSDDLSVGVEEIDEQHKLLIAVINRLFDEAIINRSDSRVLCEILNELVEHTMIHFAVEESLFRIFEYPDSENHSRHHQDLKDQIMELQEKVRTSEIKLDSDFLVILKKWIQNHIVNGDRQYGAFLLQNGVKNPEHSGD
jgi:hemerythrin